MADFEYNPVAGWEDETIFPDYPTAPEVRPMFQRLFDQIRDAFNAHKAETAADDDVHGLKFKGCLITLAAAQPIPNTTATVVTWDAEYYDTENYHSLVTNPSRVTIPAGISKVRLIANIQFANNATGYRSVNIIKNGSVTEPGKPNISQNAVNGTVTSVNISSPVLPVVEGDYFEVQVTQTSGGDLALQTGNFRTWFAMEVLQ
jgi:hypothetical protein